MSNDKTYTHIRDGYTRRGFISGLNRDGQRLAGELRFTYRPMLPSQRSTMRRILDTEKGAKLDAMFSAAIAEQLEDWSAIDDRGGAVAPSPQNVSRLPPFLYDRLYMVIAGLDPSDPEPEAEPREADEYAALLRRSAEENAPPGDLLLSEQQKN